MSTRLSGIFVILACCAGATACVTATYQHAQGPPPVAAVTQPGAEDQPFYADLNPYGQWVYVSGPGWVWSPYNVPAGWQPYQLGHWVLTDYGWTWASDENFGWAVYHYGRWMNDTGYGWVWVPGTEWGPAWVAWHEGGGWVGWAPLPWQVSWQSGVGLDWGGVSVGVALGPSAWHFAPARAMVDPGLRNYIAPVSQNVTLIQTTTNVTNYTYVDNRIVNQSVQVDTIGRAVGHPIPRYHVEQAGTPEGGHGGNVRGDKFVVFRPDPAYVSRSQRRPVPPGHDDVQHPGGFRADEPRGGNPLWRGHQPNPNEPQAPPPATEPAAEPPKQEPAPPQHVPDGRKPEPHQNRFFKAIDKASDWAKPPHPAPAQGTPAPPAGPPQNQGSAGTPGNSGASGNSGTPGRAGAPGQSRPPAPSAAPAPSAPPTAAQTHPNGPPPKTDQGKTPPGKAKGRGPSDAGTKHGSGKSPAHPDPADQDASKQKSN